jgi:hypothetical protein
MSVKFIKECCKPFSPCDDAPCNSCEGISCLDKYDIFLTFSESEIPFEELIDSPLYRLSNFSFSGRVQMEIDFFDECIHFLGEKDGYTVQYFIDEHEWAGGKHFRVNVSRSGTSKRWGWTYALGGLRVVDDNFPSCEANWFGVFKGQSANRYCEPGLNRLSIIRIPPVMSLPPNNTFEGWNLDDLGQKCEFTLRSDPLMTFAINPVQIEWIPKF